jgi:hypothetical protein
MDSNDNAKQEPTENSHQAVNKAKVTNNERNLVVSFIQFLRQKVSLNQCTDDQIEGIDGIKF